MRRATPRRAAQRGVVLWCATRAVEAPEVRSRPAVVGSGAVHLSERLTAHRDYCCRDGRRPSFTR
jgi:hypothetical protein